MKKTPKTFINVVFRHSCPYIRVAITLKAIVRISWYIPHFEGFCMPVKMQLMFCLETKFTPSCLLCGIIRSLLDRGCCETTQANCPPWPREHCPSPRRSRCRGRTGSSSCQTGLQIPRPSLPRSRPPLRFRSWLPEPILRRPLEMDSDMSGIRVT